MLTGAVLLALTASVQPIRAASPTPSRDATPSPSPEATAQPPPPAERPAGALQAMIDAASPGAVVTVPPGLYREMVTIHQGITLHGEGAEIRGADVWTDWTKQGSHWVSDGSLPKFDSGWECIEARCDWPEQAFVDGAPLLQVKSDPSAGEFAVDGDRHVVLSVDPGGHRVEVSIRKYWMVIDAPDVTIDGFTMRDAATPAQYGALQVLDGGDRAAIRHVTLSDAHAALVSFHDVVDASLADSDLRRGGQLGIQSGGKATTGLSISGNRVVDNNTEGFDASWEAGGMKLSHATGLRVTDNDVSGNDGPGVWCDIDCVDTVIENNRISDNTNTGIQFEISQGALIDGNRVTENGWGFPTWGWGAGILISSSSGADVRDNVLAWNADGITVVSQDRGNDKVDRIHDTTVEDNTIFADKAGGYLLAWLQDWNGGLYDKASDNVARDNQFWHERPEPSSCRFEWDGCKDTIKAFAATPGGTGSAYLTTPERDQVLSGDQLPTTAEVHPVGEPLRRRDQIILAGLIGAAALVLATIVVLWLRRRRRRHSA